MKTPKVSVLTPVYNTKPEYLRKCIESILNQTYTDFEFLILNDSPDNKEIEKIVKEYAKKDKRIKYYKNEHNIGISASRNKLLDLAKGEYIAVFDHDDISLPERLAKEVDFLDKHPYVGVVSGWLNIFGGYEAVAVKPQTDIEIKIALTENDFIAHTACMIRKSILTDNNIRYQEYYTPAEDYKLFGDLMDYTNFHNLQEVLVNYRFHNSNTSCTQTKEMEQAWLNIRSQIIDKHPGYRMEYERIHKKTDVCNIKRCNPRISVLMTAYNSEKYISEAIESILNQTYKDFEFIIINDGSTDNTAKIVKEYAKKDKRIKFVDNKKNQGLIAVLNQGLDLCKGEYIARMDSDDISLPKRFDKQVKYLDANPDVVVLGTHFQMFGDCTDVVCHPNEINSLDIFFDRHVGHPTVMLRKQFFHDNRLYYDKNFEYCEDYELWSRVVNIGNIRNLPEVLLKYRVHNGSVSVKYRDIQAKNTQKIKLNILSNITSSHVLKVELYKFLQSFDVGRLKPNLVSCHKYTKNKILFWKKTKAE